MISLEQRKAASGNPPSPSTEGLSVSCTPEERQGPFYSRFQNEDYHSKNSPNQPAILLICSGLQDQLTRLVVSDIEEEKPLLIRNQRIHDIGAFHLHLEIPFHDEKPTFITPVRFGSGISLNSIPFSIASSCTKDATISSPTQTIYAMEAKNPHNLHYHSSFNEWEKQYHGMKTWYSGKPIVKPRSHVKQTAESSN